MQKLHGKAPVYLEQLKPSQNHPSHKCRARIWRSEIEAYIDPSEDVSSGLQKRRESRKPCTCPPEFRLTDS